MKGIRRWRAQGTWRGTGTRRPWGAALAAAGFAGAALLLAFVFHLGVAAEALAILATAPTLYLAWRTLPSTVRKPARGRAARQWDPVELGVHRVVGGGPMPPYIRRPHDELLAAVLDPAVRASRLVVVRGASSTGKSRAAYEAVTRQLADWLLDYPLNVAALKERQDAGIPARTVLWLGELRHYADADGGSAVLARLADLLIGEGLLVITTMWPEHWAKYATAAQPGPGTADTARVAGLLLGRLPDLTGTDPAAIDPARGGVIDVPPEFTGEDLDAASRTGDMVLTAAAAAAAAAHQAGQLTQFLAGVPALLERYAGIGGDPYGQAVITAAMDAARLGHASPLPAALLLEAAVGYLTGQRRTKPLASWGQAALDWASQELNGAVRALQPIPPPAGTGIIGYQAADYLDQHGRRTRQDQLGPPSLWDALATHATGITDLARLGQAAEARGLYRYAATFWTRAAILRSYDAAIKLIDLLRRVSPEDAPAAARWAATHYSVDSAWNAAGLLFKLRQAGADDAVVRDLAQRAAVQASLDNEYGVKVLLDQMRLAGADDAVQALLARDPAAHAKVDDRVAAPVWPEWLRPAEVGDPAQASLDDPLQAAALVRELHEAGDDGVTRALARRAAAQASLDDPLGVATLLADLHAAGADDAVRALLARDPAGQVSLDHPVAAGTLMGVARLLEALREAEADEAAQALAGRAAAHASLDHPGVVAWLLRELRLAGAEDAVRALLARDPAAHATLDDLESIAALLRELRLAGADDAVQTLLARDPAQASLDDPSGVAALLRELRAAGADDAVRALLARDPAARASFDKRGVWTLLEVLREAGDDSAARALAGRAANRGMFSVCLRMYPDDAAKYRYGREPDGTPALRWRWQEPGDPNGDAWSKWPIA